MKDSKKNFGKSPIHIFEMEMSVPESTSLLLVGIDLLNYLCVIDGRPSELNQVFLNIIANSLDAILQAGAITRSTKF